MPYVSEPSVATTSNSVASGSAAPAARSTCPRGIAIVWVTVCAAGSHNQYPT